MGWATRRLTQRMQPLEAGDRFPGQLAAYEILEPKVVARRVLRNCPA
jgi:hypothetical protein